MGETRKTESIFDVSVIVPVFNPPLDRLCRCLTSIVEQPGAVELILVNDGSDGTTEAYLANYSLEKENVVIINQENRGVSAARNIGISFASAPYVMFVDSDDELEEGALAQALSVAREGNYDVLLGFSQKYYASGIPYCPIPLQQLNGEVCALEPDELLRYALTGRTKNKNLCIRHDVLDVISGGPVARLIKRDIAKRVLFPEGVAVCEDTIWNVKLFQRCDSIAVVKTCWYRYYQLRESSIHRYRANSDSVAYEAINTLRKVLDDEALEEYGFEVECRFLGEVNRVAKNYLLQECDLPIKEKRRRVRRTYERIHADLLPRNVSKGRRGMFFAVKRALCKSGTNVDVFLFKSRIESALLRARGLC